MNKMKTIPFAAAIPLAMLTGCQKENVRPNVIFIMSDDHTAQSIGAYGSIYKDICPTPNIDQLAADGALFTNTFCTNAISGPSRAAIITGNYSHVNRYYKNENAAPFDNTQTTFPMILQANGYSTSLFGKWHLESEPKGFDYYKIHSMHKGQGIYWNPVWNINGKKQREEGYATTLTANSAIEWLDSGRDKNKPFCMLLHFKAPHRPWEPDKCYEHIFDNVEMPYPETFNDDYKTRELTAGDTEMLVERHLTPKDLKVPAPEGSTPEEVRKWTSKGQKGEFWTPDPDLKGEELKKWKYQRYIKDYLAVTKSVDDQVGRVMAYLKENGLEENTIVIYCGDQGFYLGEHGWFDKRFMYEESIRMPFIVKWPAKIKPHTVMDKLVANVDFAPSILDMCQVESTVPMQGESFYDAVAGKKNAKTKDAIYFHYYEFPFWHHVQPYYGIRTDRYKLIHYYYNIDVWEMFDLEKDPNELQNIYGNAEYADIQADLHKKLEEERVKYEDTASLEEYRKMTDFKYVAPQQKNAQKNGQNKGPKNGQNK